MASDLLRIINVPVFVLSPLSRW